MSAKSNLDRNLKILTGLIRYGGNIEVGSAGGSSIWMELEGPHRPFYDWMDRRKHQSSADRYSSDMVHGNSFEVALNRAVISLIDEVRKDIRSDDDLRELGDSMPDVYRLIRDAL